MIQETFEIMESDKKKHLCHIVEGLRLPPKYPVQLHNEARLGNILTFIDLDNFISLQQMSQQFMLSPVHSGGKYTKKLLTI